jgi:nucleotide-binding universal stress UspA family protein
MSIVAGYDGRSEGRDAVALAAVLARALGEPVEVACVYLTGEAVLGVTVAELEAEARRLAAEGAAALPEDVQGEGLAVAAGSPAHGLHDLAEARQPAAVVVGSSHRGAIGHVLAGNVASRLLSASPCPVAVAPRGFADRGQEPLQVIGVGFDDSAESWNALQRAAAIGVEGGAKLRLIHALEPRIAPALDPADSELLTRELHVKREHALGRAAASVSKELHAETKLALGDPVRMLMHEADAGLDLLVLGSRGYGPVRRVLLGSVSTELVRSAPCPVLVVPRSVEFDPSAGGMAAHDELSAEPARGGRGHTPAAAPPS